MRHVLIVLSNPTEGREGEFNDWYDNVHLGEVLHVPGFVAAQRFKAGPAIPGREGPPRQYLSIYEIDTDDVAGALAALAGATRNMNMSTAIDVTSAEAWAFTEHGPRVVRS